MGNLFAKSKSRITDQDRAVLQLKQQRDSLKQYQRRIQAVLEKDRELARKLIKDGKKERAKLLLKKKRYQEQLLERTDKQLDNVEQMVHDLEFAQIQMKVLDSLKVGNQSLKEVQKLFSLEEIEKIMDETREGIEKQKEIDDLLAGALTEEDEQAVEDELDEIIKQSLPSVPQDTEEMDQGETLDLPAVPTEEPQALLKGKTKKEREPVPLPA